MYTVYALCSEFRNYIYVGITNDIDRRLNEHNKCLNKTTKAYAPFILFYTEEYPSRVTSWKREKYLKSGFGKEFLKSVLSSVE